MDRVPERLALAGKLGATPLDLSLGDVLAAVRAATNGRGVDVALEVRVRGEGRGMGYVGLVCTRWVIATARERQALSWV